MAECLANEGGLLFTEAVKTGIIGGLVRVGASAFFVFIVQNFSLMPSDATSVKLPSNRLGTFLILATATLALDLGSKTWAFEKFGVRHGSEDWIIDQSWIKFKWFTNLNPGALWGVGDGFALGFAGLSVLAFAGIIYWLFVRKAAASAWLTVSMAFVSGGTLGNMYDRLALHGVVDVGKKEPALAVRDFIYFKLGSFDWPIFNVADICLVTGAIMLMLHSFTVKDEVKDQSSSASSPATS